MIGKFSAIGAVSLTALAAVLVTPVGAEVDVENAVDVEALKVEYVRPEQIPFPEDNPYTQGKYELGHKLFFDPRLSGSGAISCASCHNPGLGWEDALPLGVGHLGTRLGRHTPTILNLAWGELFFWDGRASSLEEQSLGPIASQAEMNIDLDEVVEQLNNISAYSSAFQEEFPNEGLTADTVAKSIATFERTIVSNEAPFDEWITGDEDAISEEAKRGFVIFNTKGNCSICHVGWRFTDDGFHDIGVPDEDKGRGELIPVGVLQHAFKTPTLRNIDQRAPYLHDGSAKDLHAVVELYDNGFVERESLSSSIKKLNLTQQEKEDLVAFLHTLTSEDDPIAIPVLPK